MSKRKDNNPNRFYVYRYIRLDTNVPFYVGKGQGGRAYKISQRNKCFCEIIKNYDYCVEIIIDGLTEKQALEKEKEFIKIYYNLGYCEANLSVGGEGVTTFNIYTKEYREKISKSKLGKKPSKESCIKMSEYAKDRSPEHKENLRISLLNMSPESKTKRMASIISEKTRTANSIKNKGNKYNLGKKQTPQHIQKIIDSKNKNKDLGLKKRPYTDEEARNRHNILQKENRDMKKGFCTWKSLPSEELLSMRKYVMKTKRLTNKNK